MPQERKLRLSVANRLDSPVTLLCAYLTAVTDDVQISTFSLIVIIEKLKHERYSGASIGRDLNLIDDSIATGIIHACSFSG
jgi:hypothetical protein